MNKKGFTLIEIITVLVILSIILGMVLINVTDFSNERKEKDYNNIKSIIEKNTDMLLNDDEDIYISVNEKLMSVGDECIIEYIRLEEANLMDKGTINPKTEKVINKDSYIKVKLNDNYDFEYTFVDKDFDTSTETIDLCLTN